MKVRLSKNSKILKGIIITFSTLLVVYFGISIYFINHFHFGFEVNNISLAGKTVEEADKTIRDNIQSYVLEIKGRDNMVDEIRGNDIELKCNSEYKIQEFKDKQNPFMWIGGLFSSKNNKINEILSFNEELLDKVIDGLNIVNNKNIVEPQNPSFQYVDGEFKIIDEVEGNKINKKKLIEEIRNAILTGETSVDIDLKECYVKPKFNKSSKEVEKVKKKLDSYIQTKVIYNFGSSEEILDGSTIKDWLNVDEDMNVTFDSKGVSNYVYELAKKYNTYGTTRDFKTTYGTVVKVSGGEYGWIINKKEEAKELEEIIKEGKEVKREPIYSQKAISHDNNDFGNSYVEVSISSQHLWLYIDGSLITEGDVVTGNVNGGTPTFRGVYAIYYKQKDAVLKGPGYAQDVNYWMPFNNGIGFHDADRWRGAYGGSIYLSNGSHGCVNCPNSLAQKIYNNVYAGMPVIVY